MYTTRRFCFNIYPSSRFSKIMYLLFPSRSKRLILLLCVKDSSHHLIRVLSDSYSRACIIFRFMFSETFYIIYTHTITIFGGIIACLYIFGTFFFYFFRIPPHNNSFINFACSRLWKSFGIILLLRDKSYFLSSVSFHLFIDYYNYNL